jgi:arabinose-5-phosphate isomerase
MLDTLTRATDTDALALARRVLRIEAEALDQVADRLDDGFLRVVEILGDCQGRIAVSGVGKSADIGRKIVSTFNSTGTRAYFLDPAAAMHGDLGCVHPNDASLLFSHGGESEEIVRLVQPLRDLAAGIVAVTGQRRCTLARLADAAVVYGPIREADPLSLAPSTSTTVMLALGDALAFALAQQRGFTPEDFARVHPAGTLGLKLARVEAYMRKGNALRLAGADETVRSIFSRPGPRGRRTGAVMLLDADGRLCGLFTDSDLARLIERRGYGDLDGPIGDVMTRNPKTVVAGSLLSEATEIFRRHKISELPVVDSGLRPVGLLDITDLLHLMPADDEETDRAA